MLPSILLTGFMFPREAIPPVVRELGLLLPMTYYIGIVRGIALNSANILDVWRPALILIAFALLLVTVSVKRFSKTME